MLPKSPKSKIKKMIRQYIREKLAEKKIVSFNEIAKKFGMTEAEVIRMLK